MVDPTKRVTMGSVSLLLPITARIVALFKATTTSNTYYAMEEAGVDYLVPASKKFVLLETLSADGTDSGCMHELYQHTVANASGGTLKTTAVSGAPNIPFSNTQYAEFAAGNYVNAVPNNSGSLIFALGIELDA